MAKYEVSTQAEEDLYAIWDYLVEKSGLASADKLIRSLHQHFALLASYPQFGRARTDIRAGLRGSSVKRYLILYLPTPGGIEVVRVVHGRRDIGILFDAGEVE